MTRGSSLKLKNTSLYDTTNPFYKDNSKKEQGMGLNGVVRVALK